MSFFLNKISRRTVMQALIALPVLSLFRKFPDAETSKTDVSRADLSRAGPDEIVEVNGWILKRSDLA